MILTGNDRKELWNKTLNNLNKNKAVSALKISPKGCVFYNKGKYIFCKEVYLTLKIEGEPQEYVFVEGNPGKCHLPDNQKVLFFLKKNSILFGEQKEAEREPSILLGGTGENEDEIAVLLYVKTDRGTCFQYCNKETQTPSISSTVIDDKGTFLYLYQAMRTIFFNGGQSDGEERTSGFWMD